MNEHLATAEDVTGLVEAQPDAGFEALAVPGKADWDSTPATTSEESRGDAAASLAGSAKRLKATYEMPYLKHAPIGPTMAVADVRQDGTVFIHTHTQNPQMLRGDIAKMLGTALVLRASSNARGSVVRTWASSASVSRKRTRRGRWMR